LEGRVEEFYFKECPLWFWFPLFYWNFLLKLIKEAFFLIGGGEEVKGSLF